MLKKSYETKSVMNKIILDNLNFSLCVASLFNVIGKSAKALLIHAKIKGVSFPKTW